MGSCFAENIAEQMSKNKFKVLENPHGILYNPASIAAALRRYKDSKSMSADELFFANDCWNSWEHHSRYSHPDKEKCLSGINEAVAQAHIFLQSAQWLFLTFGTAFVYEKGGKPAGNCHKVPQKEFTKRLLETGEIVKECRQLFKELKGWNPALKIVLTVSPVRYIRDGVVENNLSKARLLDAVHQLKSDHVFYFPAYELVIDDLRDYRFYRQDMVHPNRQAIQYVYEKFREAAYDKEALSFSGKMTELLRAKEHKPFQGSSPEYKKFKAAFHQRCLELKKEYPFADLEDEIRYFS